MLYAVWVIIALILLDLKCGSKLNVVSSKCLFKVPVNDSVLTARAIADQNHYVIHFLRLVLETHLRYRESKLT